MTTWTVYVCKPSGTGFAAPVNIGLTIDDSKYQSDPPAILTNTDIPAGEQQLYVQKVLSALQGGFECHSRYTRRGYLYRASSDGGATFIAPYDESFVSVASSEE